MQTLQKNAVERKTECHSYLADKVRHGSVPVGLSDAESWLIQTRHAIGVVGELVLSSLAYLMRKHATETVQISREMLALHSGRCTKTVSRAITKLAQLSLIEFHQPPPRPFNAWTPNVYTLTASGRHLAVLLGSPTNSLIKSARDIDVSLVSLQKSKNLNSEKTTETDMSHGEFTREFHQAASPPAEPPPPPLEKTAIDKEKEGTLPPTAPSSSRELDSMRLGSTLGDVMRRTCTQVDAPKATPPPPPVEKDEGRTVKAQTVIEAINTNVKALVKADPKKYGTLPYTVEAKLRTNVCLSDLRNALAGLLQQGDTVQHPAAWIERRLQDMAKEAAIAERNHREQLAKEKRWQEKHQQWEQERAQYEARKGLLSEMFADAKRDRLHA